MLCILVPDTSAVCCFAERCESDAEVQMYVGHDVLECDWTGIF